MRVTLSSMRDLTKNMNEVTRNLTNYLDEVTKGLMSYLGDVTMNLTKNEIFGNLIRYLG